MFVKINFSTCQTEDNMWSLCDMTKAFQLLSKQNKWELIQTVACITEVLKMRDPSKGKETNLASLTVCPQEKWKQGLLQYTKKVKLLPVRPQV